MYTLLSLQEPDKHWRVYHDFCVCFGVFYGIFFPFLFFLGETAAAKCSLSATEERTCVTWEARAPDALSRIIPGVGLLLLDFYEVFFFYQREEFTQHRALNFMGLLWRWALHSTTSYAALFSPTEIKCIYYHFPHLISPRPFTKAPFSTENKY